MIYGIKHFLIKRKYPAESLIRFVARNFYKVKDRSKVRILEVGCGPGANLWFLAREGFSVYGVEGSESAVVQANERLDKECMGWDGKIQKGDILNLDYPDGYFDAAIDVEAIYCNDFEKSQDIYKEMSRVVKAGGRIYSRTFAKSCVGDETGEMVGRDAWVVNEGPLVGHGFARFTHRDDVKELCSGFEIDSVDYLHESTGDGENVVKELIILGSKLNEKPK